MHFLPGEQGSPFKFNLYDHGSGVAVADWDGDGDDDVYLLDQLGPNRLFRNDGGKFTDVTEATGTGLDDRVSVGAAFADFDLDGDLDLFVTTTRSGNVLLRNDGDRFTDVSRGSGTDEVAHPQSPIVFDFDGDGDPDIFVAHTARWTLDTYREAGSYFEGPEQLPELLRAEPERNRLYRNDGGMRFTDVAETAGVAGPGWTSDAAVFDYDDDGDPDFYVGNMFGGSALYRNDGGRFTDVTATALGRTPWGAIGTKAFDADVDGRLDLLVTDMHSDMWPSLKMTSTRVDERRRYDGPDGPLVEWGAMTAEQRDRTYTGLLERRPDSVYGNALFRSLGDGKFADVSDRAGVETFWPWGIAVADFDVDGDEDVFVASGMGWPWFHWRTPFLRNRGDGTFEECAKEVGLDPLPGGTYRSLPFGQAARSSRAAAVGDFDADGRPDLVVNSFNDRAFLWMSRFPQKRWIAFRLDASHGAREAYGARVTIRAGGRTQVRQVQPNGGYLSQSTRTLHFGLGDAPAVDSVEIRWPGGRRQTIDHPALDRVHVVAEPREGSGTPR
jgi:hypothetical protein